MSQQEHPFFGPLDTTSIEETDVIWEAILELNEQPVDTSLWAESGQALEDSRLDTFAHLLEHLPELDARARTALTSYLEDDREFIDYYTDALDEGAEGLDSTQALREQAQADGISQVDASAFVSAMRLTNIGLWFTVEGSPVVLDYRLDPEASDQILAVKCDAQGQVVSIDWES